MKRLSYILGVIFLMASCTPSSNYLLENELLYCHYAFGKGAGLDYEKSYDDIEQLFVDYGLLDSKNGVGYIRLLKNMKKSDGFHSKNNKELYRELASLKKVPNRMTCADEIVVKNLSSTKLELFNEKINATVAKEFVKGKPVAKIYGKEVLKVFNKKDLDHEFYQSILLSSLRALFMSEHIREKGGNNVNLPPWDE